MNDIQNFHIQYNYYVSVEKISNSLGCIAKFPKNIFINQDRFDKTYMINLVDLNIETFVLQNSKIVKSNNTKVSRIMMRPVIAFDILINALKLNIREKLIVVEDGKKIFDLLEFDHTNEEAKLEQELCSSFFNYLNSNYNNGVEGLSQMIDVLNDGGL